MIQNKNQKATITDIAAYRAARRRAGNIRWVLILVFLVACMFGGYFFAISSFFSITQIQVEGSTTVDAQRIIEDPMCSWVTIFFRWIGGEPFSVFSWSPG